MNAKRRRKQPDRPTPATIARPWPFAATVISALLVLAVFLVFGQTLTHDFLNYDDNLYVTENPQVSQGLSLPNVLWATTARCAGNWHPITLISHMTDCQIYGLRPWGHHLTNVLLHAMNAVLLFLVLRRMTGSIWPSALAAALFAVHPLRVESVAWVAERKDLLGGLFFLLTLWAYTGYVRCGGWPRYLGAMAWFALGLMSKPSVVTLPFVLLLLDYWPLGRVASGQWPVARDRPRDSNSASGAASCPSLATDHRPLPTLLLEKLPLFLLSIASCVVTPWAQGSAVMSLDLIPFSLRLANALVAYAVYLGDFFFPVGLAVFYPHPGPGLAWWKPLAAAVFLAAVSAAAIATRRRFPYAAVGWFWYFGMLVPMIGLVQVGVHAMADRYTYLPEIGLCIAVAWGIRHACVTWPGARRTCIATASAAVVVLMGGAWQQTTYWRDSETLWRRAAQCTSRNARAHNNLGIAMAARGDLNAATAEYRAALDIKPDYTDALNNLGVALSQQGRTDAAIQQFQKVLNVNPQYAKARFNWGTALAKQGRNDAAVQQFRLALDADPSLDGARYSLGVALAACGRTNDAIDEFREVLRQKPNLADTHFNLGALLSERGDFEEALTHWFEAIRQRPDDVGYLDQTAWTLATCPKASVRNGPEAVRLAQRAVELSGGRDPARLDTLGAALAEAGRFDEAQAAARQALDLAAQQHRTDLIQPIRVRRSLYEKKQPYRESPQR
ncbi:MAG: tetratricopeptide repeat protein [Thermoguttaceae bacterium]